MERETKEVTTPVGKQKVAIKTWLTGFERRKIQSILLSNTEFSMNGKEPNIGNVKGELLAKLQDITIETTIDSIDGKKENILEAVGNMHSADFDFIVEEVNKIHSVTDKKK